MNLPTLTYFSSRGRAEIIRLVCAAAELAYEERSLGVYHPVDKTPDFEALKATGVLPFGAVPLWEEPGGLRLAQSDAITRHLARAHGLYGADAREAARCDMIFAGVDDARVEVRRVITTEPEKRAAFREELRAVILPRWLGYFEKLLGAEGTGFIVGDRASFADVALFLMFENIRDNGLGGAYESCPALVKHAERMAARPGIAAYLASPKRFPVQLLPT
ncbi:MAG: glutathione S-transferase [Minicystis sp.]